MSERLHLARTTLSLTQLIDTADKVSWVLDKTSMPHVESFRGGAQGERTKHRVKPLELIWRKFPDFYCRRNTLHVDDLSRNFAMNPGNGLKIKREFLDGQELANERARCFGCTRRARETD